MNKDKVEMTMTEDGSLSTGSLYSLNQQAYNKVRPLNIKEKHEQLDNIYEWTKEQRCDYTMLLCHERRDYTIFRYSDRENETYHKSAFNDLKECIDNRGKLLDVRYIQSQDAWEIWIRIFEEEGPQNYMYMFFNAEGFVVEV